MNCDKSHELCFAHELFASEHELANAMKNIARGEYKQPLLNEVGVRPQGHPCRSDKTSVKCPYGVKNRHITRDMPVFDYL